MIENKDNWTNERIYSNELHNDKYMNFIFFTNINKLFIEIFQEQSIQLWEKSFKEWQMSNIKIIKERAKIQMDKCHGYNITFYVNPQWKWFSLKNT